MQNQSLVFCRTRFLQQANAVILLTLLGIVAGSVIVWWLVGTMRFSTGVGICAGSISVVCMLHWLAQLQVATLQIDDTTIIATDVRKRIVGRYDLCHCKYFPAKSGTYAGELRFMEMSPSTKVRASIMIPRDFDQQCVLEAALMEMCGRGGEIKGVTGKSKGEIKGAGVVDLE